MIGTTKIRARADDDGVVHLDLPAALPNGEVEVEIRMRPVLSGAASLRTTHPWDRRFFEGFLGDRAPRKRRAGDALGFERTQVSRGRVLDVGELVTGLSHQHRTATVKDRTLPMVFNRTATRESLLPTPTTSAALLSGRSQVVSHPKTAFLPVAARPAARPPNVRRAGKAPARQAG